MATERLQVYRCEKCGMIVEVLRGSGAKLVCCSQDMKLLKEGEVDAAAEKHVPVIEKIDSGFKVKVGEVSHPMEKMHFIEWIELIADGSLFRKFLKPGDPPEATFNIEADRVTAREYCNLHGLWKA